VQGRRDLEPLSSVGKANGERDGFMSGELLRFGVLGAAKITPDALIKPAAESERAEVVAIAARDPERARAFAEEHAIPQVDVSYEALVRNPDVDAVYNPLPASLHHEWTLEALQQGKHVLCEKPFASNESEAEQMVAAARESGLVLLEAFHYRYHPLASRILEVLASGVIGEFREIEAAFCVPIPDTGDIRYDLSLGGGATMDLGCYPIHWCRLATGTEPTVLGAEAREEPSGIDVTMTAELRFPEDVPCKVHCSMAAEVGFQAFLQVTGSKGLLRADNPLVPHFGHQLRLTIDGSEKAEQVEGRTTYDHQLDAFVASVLHGEEQPTGGEDGIANMRVIDAIYRAAGMQPRGTTA
jgi:predicted dehydrogenase